MIDLDALDALAANATPGQWASDVEFAGCSSRLVFPEESWDDEDGLIGDGIGVIDKPADAAFIAACDPTTIRQLVARIRELEAALSEVAPFLDSKYGARARSVLAGDPE